MNGHGHRGRNHRLREQDRNGALDRHHGHHPAESSVDDRQDTEHLHDGGGGARASKAEVS